MGRNVWLAVIAVVAIALLAFGRSAPAATQHGGSTTASLSVVPIPTTFSVTVSPGTTSFGGCSGGAAPFASSATDLGYPSGRCSVGKPGAAGSFPITIKNTGTAADIDVYASNAVPSDGGTQWRLCDLGARPRVACNGPVGLPGPDQYLAENFTKGRQNSAGLTRASACDAEFDSAGGCLAGIGQSRSEGVEVIGPTRSTDHSTSWTVTITWIAVAP